MTETIEKRTHFIRQLLTEDLRSGKHTHITTRFPPEPNGYLHVGHAKSICLNFGLAQRYGPQVPARWTFRAGRPPCGKLCKVFARAKREAPPSGR